MKRFTIIELLIIIAVTSVLVTILIPTFTEARERTISTACKANLGQLYIWSSLYLKENDHHYMSQPDSLFSNNWQELLTEAPKKSKSFTCPKVPELYLNHEKSTYGLNLMLKGKVAHLAATPSTSLMLGDGEKYSSTKTDGSHWWKPTLERHSLQATDLIHMQKMNITYLDGRIDSKNLNDMKQSEPLWKF